MPGKDLESVYSEHTAYYVMKRGEIVFTHDVKKNKAVTLDANKLMRDYYGLQREWVPVIVSYTPGVGHKIECSVVGEDLEFAEKHACVSREIDEDAALILIRSAKA